MNPNNIRPNPISPHPYQNYYPPVQNPSPSLTIPLQPSSKYSKPNVYGSNFQYFHPNKPYMQNGSTPSTSQSTPSASDNVNMSTSTKQQSTVDQLKDEKLSHDIEILFPKSKLYSRLIELDKKIDFLLKRRQFSRQKRDKRKKDWKRKG